MEEAKAYFILFQHDGNRSFLINRRVTRTPAFGVRGEGGLQFVGKPQVVHNQAAWFVAKDAVHARDRLHQSVGAHRFVKIHRVQARTVETRQPHVAHDNDLERIVRVAKTLG
jgi:hypothetical protein